MSRGFYTVLILFTVVLTYSYDIADGKNIIVHPFLMDPRPISLAWFIYFNCEIAIRSILYYIIYRLTKTKGTPFYNDIALIFLLYNLMDFFTFNCWYNDYNKVTDMAALMLCIMFVFIVNKSRVDDLFG